MLLPGWSAMPAVDQVAQALVVVAGPEPPRLFDQATWVTPMLSPAAPPRASGVVAGALTAGPGDLGDAEVIAGSAAEGERRGARREGAAPGGGARDGDRWRRRIGTGGRGAEGDELHGPVAAGVEQGAGAVGAGGGDDAVMNDVAVGTGD